MAVALTRHPGGFVIGLCVGAVERRPGNRRLTLTPNP